MSVSQRGCEDNRREGQTRIVHILIADDHEVVRDGLRGFLECDTNYVVMAEAADGEEASPRLSRRNLTSRSSTTQCRW